MPTVPTLFANGASTTQTPTHNVQANDQHSPVSQKNTSRENTSNNSVDSTVPHDSTLISYQDPLISLDSKLQLAWHSVYDPDYYVSSKRYNHVACFLLSWDETNDDLNVTKEIDGLTKVLEETYHFNVTHEKIRKIDKKIAQTQINYLLAQWVHQHDSPKTLLLVYFAGHGMPGRNRNGELELAGHQCSKNVDEDSINMVVWNWTENILQHIQSDVLQIFDCCHAAYLGPMQRASNHAFEYIAACAANASTPGPGPRSFTTALIWALERLAGEGPFTAVTLLEKVKQAVDFSKRQEPHLSSRNLSHANERIVLQPLNPMQEDVIPGSSLENFNKPKDSRSSQDVVTLKFIFDARPEVEDIKKLAEGIGLLISNRELMVSRTIWGGIKARANGDALTTAVTHFMTQRKARQGAKVAEKIAEVGHALQEDIQEQVHERVVEETQAEFAAYSTVERAESRKQN